MDRRRPKTAAPSARPIATRVEVLATLVALQCVASADAFAQPAPTTTASAPTAPASASAAASAGPAPSAAPSGLPLISTAPSSEDIPVPDLGSGATLSVRNVTPSTKPILYVDGRPVPPVAWSSLTIAPGIHEIVMDYPGGESPLETRRVSVAPGSTTDLQFGRDPTVIEQMGGAMPMEHFSGGGCCGQKGVDATAANTGGPATATLLMGAILLARRRRKPPPID